MLLELECINYGLVEYEFSYSLKVQETGGKYKFCTKFLNMKRYM